MKVSQPNTDCNVDFTILADGKKLSEYIRPGNQTLKPGPVECFIPIEEGANISINGVFTGSACQVRIDILADGSFVQNRFIESSNVNGSKLHHFSAKRCEFKTFMHVPEPEEHAPNMKPLVSEGYLSVKNLPTGISDALVDGKYEAPELGVGTLAVAINVGQKEGSAYNHQGYSPYNSNTLGTWKEQTYPVIASGVRAQHGFEMDTFPGSNPVSMKRASGFWRDYTGPRPSMDIGPWMILVFYYRSLAAIKEAGLVLLPPGDSRAVDPFKGRWRDARDPASMMPDEPTPKPKKKSLNLGQPLVLPKDGHTAPDGAGIAELAALHRQAVERDEAALTEPDQATSPDAFQPDRDASPVKPESLFHDDPDLAFLNDTTSFKMEDAGPAEADKSLFLDPGMDLDDGNEALPDPTTNAAETPNKAASSFDFEVFEKDFLTPAKDSDTQLGKPAIQGIGNSAQSDLDGTTMDDIFNWVPNPMDPGTTAVSKPATPAPSVSTPPPASALGKRPASPAPPVNSATQDLSTEHPDAPPAKKPRVQNLAERRAAVQERVAAQKARKEAVMRKIAEEREARAEAKRVEAAERKRVEEEAEAERKRVAAEEAERLRIKEERRLAEEEAERKRLEEEAERKRVEEEEAAKKLFEEQLAEEMRLQEEAEKARCEAEEKLAEEEEAELEREEREAREADEEIERMEREWEEGVRAREG